MNIEYVCHQMNVNIFEFRDLLKETLKFYNMEDVNEDEKIFLFVLAKIRDLNSDEFNMYQIGNKVKVTDGKTSLDLPYDERFYENLFIFLEKMNLNYTLR